MGPAATRSGAVTADLDVPTLRTPLPSAAADEALVALAREGNEPALHELLGRYRGFARSKARTYFLVGGDREDVVQEGMIGLYKAIRDYDHGQQASFRSFAELCVTRQIQTAVKLANRKKHTPLNRYVSFDRPHDDEDDGRTLGDTIADTDTADPLRRLIASDDLSRLHRTFSELLSSLESQVLRLYVEGRSYQEIAEAVGRHTKAVDNALQRVKRKLEQHLAEDR